MLGKRILILGTGGAGKSTLAKEMGEILELEVIHLDSYYWEPGWVVPKDEKWDKIIEELLDKESYIMDGNYNRTIEKRASYADTAIFIDVSRIIALYRILKRRIKYRNTSRPDMREGCNEKIDWHFVKWIWNYPKKKQTVLDKLDRSGADVIILKGLKDVRKFRSDLNERKFSK